MQTHSFNSVGSQAYFEEYSHYDEVLGQYVYVKQVSPQNESTNQLDVLKNEYDLLQRYNVKGLPTPLHYSPGRLVLQEVKGKALPFYTEGFRNDRKLFLRMAIHLAKTVARIQNAGLLHQQLTPNCIYWDPSRETIVVLHTEAMIRENGDVGDKSMRAKLTPYSAPELVGGSVKVDERADVYSLGVILYEMLTGQLPYQHQQSEDWYYDLQTDTPPDPKAFCDDVPAPLVSILMKSLEKDRQQRYDHALSLCVDLEKLFLNLYHAHPSHDDPGRFCVKGRFTNEFPNTSTSHSVDAMIDLLSEVRLGISAISFVTGAAGAGTTPVVRNVLRQMAREKAIIVEVAVQPTAQERPYHLMVTILRQTIRQVATTYPALFNDIREQMSQRFQAIPGWLTTLIPELLWMGQMSVPEEGISSKQAWEDYFLQFFQLVANSERPVVLLLDHVQWGDVMTRKRLRKWMLEGYLPYVYIIATSTRQEEHFFSIQESSSPCLRLTHHHLSPLSFEEISCLLKELFHLQSSQSFLLAEGLFLLTQGNPLQINTYLYTLVAKEVLFVDVDKGQWCYDLDRLNLLIENAADQSLLQEKLRHLPEEITTLLQLVACRGTAVMASELGRVKNTTQQIVEDTLHLAIKQGLLIEDSEKKGRFSLPEPFRSHVMKEGNQQFLKEVHKRWLFEDLQQIQKASKDHAVDLYGVTHHYEGAGRPQLPADLHHIMIDILLRFAEKSMQIQAFERALSYCQHVQELLQRSFASSQTDCQFAQVLTCQIAVQLQQGVYTDVEETIHYLKKHIHSKEEQIKAYQRLMTDADIVGKKKEAIQYGLEACHLLGVSLLKRPGVTSQWLKSIFQPFYPTNLSLVKPRRPIDSNVKMRFLIDFMQVCFLEEKQLLAAVTMHAYRDIENVHVRFHPMILSFYALHLLIYEGDVSSGRRLLAKAETLLKSTQHQTQKGWMKYIYGSWMLPWTTSLQNGPQVLEEGGRYLHDALDRRLLPRMLSAWVLSMLEAGQPLHTLQMKIGQWQGGELIRRRRTFVEHVIRSIEEGQGSLQPLEKGSVAERDLWPYIHIHCLFWTGSYANVIQKMKTMRSHGELGNWMEPGVINAYVMEALAFIYTLKPGDSKKTKRVVLRQLRGAMKIVRKAERRNDVSVAHKTYLLLAEEARLSYDDETAERFYEMAGNEARKQGIYHFAALAAERAASMLVMNERQKTARWFAEEASNNYQAWGAFAKVRQLKNSYAIEEETSGELKDKVNMDSSSHLALMHRIDVETIAHASQMISKDIRLNTLAETLLTLVLQYVGGEKGVLYLLRNDRYYVEAILEDDTYRWFSPRQLSADAYAGGCPEVIEQVIKDKEPVILTRPADHSLWMNSYYIAKHRPLFILSIPIIRKETVFAMIYIENYKTEKSFSEAKIKMVELLASQIAISLENALFTEKLEDEVRSRTYALEQSYAELEQKSKRLIEVEQSRKQLISNISHDLQSPVAIMKGYVETLLDGVVNDETRKEKYLLGLLEKVNQLSGLIQTLFQLAKLETGELNLIRKKVDVAWMMDFLEEKLSFELGEEGVQFQVKGERFDHQQIAVHLDSIERVFMNLIGNALEHGGTVTSVQIEFFCWGQTLYVKVKDDGRGIDDKDMPYLFNRFYQGYAAKKGSGLGLAICKELVLYHGGDMWAESSKDKGAIFVFTLPLSHENEEN
ncbi:AAA family ATPase [Bacillaceae bacterium SIJ1]|uniref:ATP-binding protein n=1 Tax=Litoribacterium kuwaitense TaxID=1398745 RepID=UPI0013EA461D|nr:ATP-binding protein [Litoribacterium kuwaitense]NGP44705.1 AAA family ATPase [Litoribacterium kuwaitense]